MLASIRGWFLLIADPHATLLPPAKRWGLVITSALLVVIGGGLGLGFIAIAPWTDPPSGDFVSGWLVGSWVAAFLMESRRLIFIPDKQRPSRSAEQVHAE